MSFSLSTYLNEAFQSKYLDMILNEPGGMFKFAYVPKYNLHYISNLGTNGQGPSRIRAGKLDSLVKRLQKIDKFYSDEFVFSKYGKTTYSKMEKLIEKYKKEFDAVLKSIQTIGKNMKPDATMLMSLFGASSNLYQLTDDMFELYTYDEIKRHRLMKHLNDYKANNLVFWFGGESRTDGAANTLLGVTYDNEIKIANGQSFIEHNGRSYNEFDMFIDKIKNKIEQSLDNSKPVSITWYKDDDIQFKFPQTSTIYLPFLDYTGVRRVIKQYEHNYTYGRNVDGMLGVQTSSGKAASAGSISSESSNFSRHIGWGKCPDDYFIVYKNINDQLAYKTKELKATRAQHIKNTDIEYPRLKACKLVDNFGMPIPYDSSKDEFNLEFLQRKMSKMNDMIDYIKKKREMPIIWKQANRIKITTNNYIDKVNTLFDKMYTPSFIQTCMDKSCTDQCLNEQEKILRNLNTLTTKMLQVITCVAKGEEGFEVLRKQIEDGEYNNSDTGETVDVIKRKLTRFCEEELVQTWIAVNEHFKIISDLTGFNFKIDSII